MKTKEIVKEAIVEYFKPLVRIWKWLSKPLPEGVCQAFRYNEPCKVCWECVGVFAFVILVLYLLS